MLLFSLHRTAAFSEELLCIQFWHTLCVRYYVTVLNYTGLLPSVKSCCVFRFDTHTHCVRYCFLLHRTAAFSEELLCIQVWHTHCMRYYVTVLYYTGLLPSVKSCCVFRFDTHIVCITMLLFSITQDCCLQWRVAVYSGLTHTLYALLCYCSLLHRTAAFSKELLCVQVWHTHCVRYYVTVLYYTGLLPLVKSCCVFSLTHTLCALLCYCSLLHRTAAFSKEFLCIQVWHTHCMRYNVTVLLTQDCCLQWRVVVYSVLTHTLCALLCYCSLLHRTATFSKELLCIQVWHKHCVRYYVTFLYYTGLLPSVKSCCVFRFDTNIVCVTMLLFSITQDCCLQWRVAVYSGLTHTLCALLCYCSLLHRTAAFSKELLCIQVWHTHCVRYYVTVLYYTGLLPSVKSCCVFRLTHTLCALLCYCSLLHRTAAFSKELLCIQVWHTHCMRYNVTVLLTQDCCLQWRVVVYSVLTHTASSSNSYKTMLTVCTDVYLPVGSDLLSSPLDHIGRYLICDHLKSVSRTQ